MWNLVHFKHFFVLYVKVEGRLEEAGRHWAHLSSRVLLVSRCLIQTSLKLSIQLVLQCPCSLAVDAEHVLSIDSRNLCHLDLETVSFQGL